MTSAKFTIGASAFADGGYDIANAATVDLQLEDQPATDITSCVYSVRTKSKDAPDPVLSNSGVASPPGGVVTFTAPASGVHSYEISCVTNNGAAIVRADGSRDYDSNTKSRIISIRGPNSGLRKMVPAESTQYSSAGWTDTQNESVDAQESNTVANVKTFGARGDGVTNDTAAIQAAAASLLPGGRLVFPQPAVDYLVTSLHFTQPVHLDGDGMVTIRSPNTGGATAVIVVDNGAGGAMTGDVAFTNLFVKYTGAQNPGVDISGIKCSATGRAAFSRVESSGSCFAGIYGVAGSGDGICDNVYSHDHGWGGISWTGRSFTAHACRTEGNGPEFNALDGYGITTHCDYVSLVGNISGGNRTMQFDVHSTTKLVDISHNLVFFDGSENGAYAQAISVSDTAQQCTVRGNIIRGTGSNTVQGGIEIAGDPSTIRPTNDVIIAGNQISDIGTITYGISAFVVDPNAVCIQDNVLRNVSGTYAIAVSTSIPSGYLAGSRFIPRVVRVERNTIVDSGIVAVDIGAEVWFDKNTWVWTRATGAPATPFIVRQYKYAIGRVHWGRNEAIGFTTSKQSPAITAAPTEWSWAKGDTRMNDAPSTGGVVMWHCTTPGTAAAVIPANTTGSTTAAGSSSDHKLVYKVADPTNVMVGDFLTVAGEFGGTAVEVVAKQDWIGPVSTTSGTKTINVVQALIGFFAVNDYVCVQGCTFNGGSQFSKVTAVGASTLTVQDNADATVSNAPIGLHRFWVRYIGAVTGVTNATVTWQTAVFDTISLGVANSTMWTTSGSDGLVKAAGYIGFRLGSDSPNIDTGVFQRLSANFAIDANTSDNFIIRAAGSGKYLDFIAGNGTATNGQIFTQSGAFEMGDGAAFTAVRWTLNGNSACTVDTGASVTSYAHKFNGSARFTMNSTGFAFWSATPVAQASRVGQLTDSTTGVASTTIGDVGGAFSQSTLNNIHASLLAKINALELIVHNVGLSA